MDKEIQRIIELLPKLDPTSASYKDALENLRSLIWINNDYESLNEENRRTYSPESPTKEIKAEEIKPLEPTPFSESVSTTVVAEQEPVTTVSKPEIKDPTSLTKADVRAMLADASKKGIQIQPIISKFIPEGKAIKFSEVPESEYPALVKELADAR